MESISEASVDQLSLISQTVSRSDDANEYKITFSFWIDSGLGYQTIEDKISLRFIEKTPIRISA